MSQTNLRPDLRDHLHRRLQAFAEGFRQNLALIGPAGSGKTFQLHPLISQSATHPMVIYCPLFKESCRFFLSRFLKAVLQAGLGNVSSGFNEESLEELIQRADPVLPKTVAAVRAVNEGLMRKLSIEAFNRTLDVIPILVRERGQPCILILDEFLYLEDLGIAHAFHELGKRVMTWPSTLFILTSSSVFRSRAILREKLHLLFGQFEILTLNTLDESCAVSWMREQLSGVPGVEAWSAFLFRWLGAFPWYLTAFVKRLNELALLSVEARTPSESLLFQTAWDLLGAPDGYLNQWCRVRTAMFEYGHQGARSMELWVHIAMGARTTTELGTRVGRAGLTRVLQWLIENDLVQRKGTCLVIPDPILRCWAYTVLYSQRQGGIQDDRQFRVRLEQYLSGLWTQWLHNSRRSFSEHVVQLLANFRDDTVSLDSKTGRLPKFHTIRMKRPHLAEAEETYLVAEAVDKHWCASVQEGPVDENAIMRFEAFCRTQSPRPSRKIVIAKSGLDPNAKLLAKNANIWVWESEDLHTLVELYGQPY